MFTWLTPPQSLLSYSNVAPSTLPGYHTLDLSAFVPSGTSTVLLQVTLGASVARTQGQQPHYSSPAPVVRLELRKNGTATNAAVFATDRWETSSHLLCPLDSARTLQWQFNNEANARCRLTLLLVGYE